jgi:hypothetical protein
MIKYENSTLNKYIKVYTDIDLTVDFVFPVNKIDRENLRIENLGTEKKLFVLQESTNEAMLR